MFDRSVTEAASWRLASEVARRHPRRVRLIRGHPGGGQYDVLWIRSADDGGPGSVPLNRNGTIQVHERFDGRPAEGWEPTPWQEYLSADPRSFLLRLEEAAGLRPPSTTPSSTPTTLTYRVLAAVAATAVLTVHPVDIEEGFIDTSGYGGGPNAHLEAFDIGPECLAARPTDLFGEPGYRFWIVLRDGSPLVAVDQSNARAWSASGGPPVDLVDLHRASGRDVAVVAGEVLRRGVGG